MLSALLLRSGSAIASASKSTLFTADLERRPQPVAFVETPSNSRPSANTISLTKTPQSAPLPEQGSHSATSGLKTMSGHVSARRSVSTAQTQPPELYFQPASAS